MPADNIANAIQQELRRHVVQKLNNRTLSLTEELMGYSMYAANVEAQYAPKLDEQAPKRRVVAPEFLTGLLNNFEV